jgi:hypothetical protein
VVHRQRLTDNAVDMLSDNELESSDVDEVVYSRGAAARIVTIDRSCSSPTRSVQMESERAGGMIGRRSSRAPTEKNEAARVAMQNTLKNLRSTALATTYEQVDSLAERQKALKAATGPRKKGRKSKQDWKRAVNAEVQAIQAEMDELR